MTDNNNNIKQDDFESTRRISVYEREQINDEWAKTVDGNLETVADVSPSAAADKLEVKAGDSPEFRSKLNNVYHRYRFLEKYAEGGYGIIYKAIDRTLDRVVIIKSLRKEFNGDEIAEKRFISEAKLNAQLDHPSIVPLYSLDSDAQEGLHLAMKFIDGLTLKDFLTRLKVKYNLNKISQPVERKSLRSRLEYFIKICQAVEYSHSRDVIHCDLKPENIMIGTYGEVYIMDWGTAAAPGISQKGELEGTPAYLSPETLTNGSTSSLGDIFSLGLILFELVTFKRAVDGTSVKEITTKIKSGEFEPIEHYVPRLKIQPGLKAIIGKSMSLSPQSRYQSANELAEDVRRFMFHEEVLAKPDTPLQKIARKMYHNRVKSFGILAALLLIMAGLSAFSFYRQAVAGEEASFKILRHIRFQIATEQQANTIDKYFLHMQNLLQTFSSSLIFAMENPPQNGYKGRIYSLEQFKNRAQQPPDFKYSKAYGAPVSLDFPVYQCLKRLSKKNIEQNVRKVYILRGLAESILLQSEPGILLTSKNKQALTKLMLNEGVPAKRLFTVLEDGLFISYPGSKDINVWNDPRSWDWYKQAQASKKTSWGSSYIDSSGHMMLPCATPLINLKGQVLGIAGIDMSFNYIVKRLMRDIPFQDGIEKYLINDKGQVVISSIYKKYSQKTGATPKVRSLRPFLYKDILDKMLETGERQFETEIDDVKYIFSYASIPSLKWYYVQVIRFDKLMSYDPGKLDPQDKRAFQKYHEYRDSALKKYVPAAKTQSKTIKEKVKTGTSRNQ